MMTITEAYNKGYADGEHDGYYSTCIKNGIEKSAYNPPSVQPERAKGHWIHWSRSDECSNCGYNTGKYEEGSNYCPNCGARMDGEHE